ncbi:MAG: phospholipase [Chloroflexi bacterium]|nr:MAG: phospholipase [Chloroflexota bacterium]
MTAHPHIGQPILTAGKPLHEAKAAAILIHGRGASATSMLSLAQALPHPDYAYLIPQAANNTWYPQRFIAPIEANEPYLSSALSVITQLIEQVEAAGIPAQRIVIGGFSQGACLTAEYIARYPKRYGGALIFSGGVIGPEGTTFNYTGNLEGTPIFIGCSDVDFHIPLARVHETAEVFRKMGAEVTEKIYPSMGHTINEDELQQAQAIINRVIVK